MHHLPFSCRLQGIPFLVAFLTPVLLILTFNTIAFIVIFHSLLKTGSKLTADLKITAYQHARQGAAVFVLLGVTWLFGVLAVGDAKIVFQYLFCIFNSLQGLLIFVLYCLLSETTRNKYRRFFSRKLRYLPNRRVTLGTDCPNAQCGESPGIEMRPRYVNPHALSNEQ